MKVNENEVRATLEQIQADLDSWNQATFATPGHERGVETCGTTMCFAGHTLVRHGYTLDRWGWFHTPDGVKLVGGQIETQAADILGFDDTQIDEVFYFFPENRFEDLNLDIPGKDALFRVFAEHVSDVTGVKL